MRKPCTEGIADAPRDAARVEPEDVDIGIARKVERQRVVISTEVPFEVQAVPSSECGRRRGDRLESVIAVHAYPNPLKVPCRHAVDQGRAIGHRKERRLPFGTRKGTIGCTHARPVT